MKLLRSFVAVLFLCLLLTGCKEYNFLPSDPVLRSLPAYEKEQMATHGGFQDYIDYGKYTYADVTREMLDENPYLRVVTAEDIPELQKHLADFEDWVERSKDCEDCRLAEKYDFSSSYFQEGDYFRVKAEYMETDLGYRICSRYDMYYFDVETQILYYFHNNI